DAAKEGKKLWEKKVGPVARVRYPGTRSTPTVAGDLLFALSSDGDLVCLKTAKGEEVWRKHLRRDFGGRYGNWAYAESPLVDEDRVIVTPGGRDTTLVALKKKDGDVIWKAAIPEATGNSGGYSSAAIGTVGGIKQYIQFLARGVVGVNAKDGKLLWR